MKYSLQQIKRPIFIFSVIYREMIDRIWNTKAKPNKYTKSIRFKFI